jgi:hypothetical protein
MPSDWIRNKAAQESAQQAAQLAHEEKQKRDAELIKALGPQLVKGLRKVIDDDIVTWNENFKDRQINGTRDLPNGFSVAKVSFPRGAADITFNPATSRIEVTLTRSTMAGPQETYEHEGWFYIEVNSDGKGVHMLTRSRRDHIEAAGVSRMILESIAEPTSQWMI